MSDAWVGLAGVVVGVLATTLRDYWVGGRTFRREKKWTLYESTQGRLEELYCLVDQHRQAQGGFIVVCALALRTGKWPASSDRPQLAGERMKMLGALYAPELRGAFDLVEKEQGKVVQITAQVAEGLSKLDPGAKDALLRQTTDTGIKLDAAYASLLSEIAKASIQLRDRTVAADLM